MIGAALTGLPVPRIAMASPAEDDRADHGMPQCLVSIEPPACWFVVRPFSMAGREP